jgi:hypothetical protein
VRAISTVVDVSVFLLLVSAAAATLVFAPGPGPGSEPVAVDDRANLLASVTADPNYELRGRERRAHGTVASLLARGTVANTSIAGHSLSGGRAEFLERVRAATRRTLGRENRTSVVARWTPYRGSPLRGTVRVGPEPPPGGDVTVATLTVPAPVASVGTRGAQRARTDGFDGVASLLARETAGAVLPRSRATLPAASDAPATTVTSDRFQGLAAATGVRVSGPLTRGDVAVAHRRAVRGLTETFAADLSARFETPEAAAAALRTGTVRITLRRWEA